MLRNTIEKKRLTQDQLGLINWKPITKVLFFLPSRFAPFRTHIDKFFKKYISKTTQNFVLVCLSCPNQDGHNRLY